MKLLFGIAASALLTVSRLAAHEGHEHAPGDKKEDLAAGETKKITGEVVDMACYVDHNATARSTSIAQRSALRAVSRLA